jgi:hypothetical protein
VVWDNLNAHVSGAMAELIAFGDRLALARLPNAIVGRHDGTFDLYLVRRAQISEVPDE